MRKITGCEIFNEVDGKYYTLYVEWLDSHFKIILLESTMPPLRGEMDANSINYFCDELCKSSGEYLDEAKKIFCGKNNGIQFYMKDKTLLWKRNIWTLGKIELHSILDIQIICESFQQLLKIYQSIQDKMKEMEEENKTLVDRNKELSCKIEEMITKKTTMEQDLYKKFIVLLNSKKKRIRELEDGRKETENVAESIFNATTDESEESEKEEQIACINRKVSNKSSKRKSLDNSISKSFQKNRKMNYLAEDKEICKASSSKDYANDADYSLNDGKRSKKENVCEEQSCSKQNMTLRSCLSFIEEESEEELFSQ